MNILRILHVSTGMPLAEGPLDQGISWFEGGGCVRRKYLCMENRSASSVPGPSIHTFFFTGFDHGWAGRTKTGRQVKTRWLTAQGLPFRLPWLAVPDNDPHIRIERLSSAPKRVTP